jgi:hypothetical protein
MRKKTEPQTQQHPTTSRAGARKKGLIVKEQSSPRSDREACALDNRSHKNAEHKARRADAATLQRARNHARPSVAFMQSFK